MYCACLKHYPKRYQPGWIQILQLPSLGPYHNTTTNTIRLDFLLKGILLKTTGGFFPSPRCWVSLESSETSTSAGLILQDPFRLLSVCSSRSRPKPKPTIATGRTFQERASNPDHMKARFCWRLFALSGLFVGCSSAMNCVGAVLAARRLRPAREETKVVKVVTVLCDSGSRGVSRQVGFFSGTSCLLFWREGGGHDTIGLLAWLLIRYRLFFFCALERRCIGHK